MWLPVGCCRHNALILEIKAVEQLLPIQEAQILTYLRLSRHKVGLIINFNTPYLAVSPSDFWRRWHISLSTWLRDYLYVSLGGNRFGPLMTYRNLLITMLLGGLWHGANWTFFAWGFYHGAILCAYRLLNISDDIATESAAGRAYWLWRVFLMFHLTCIGWLLFRAGAPSMGME